MSTKDVVAKLNLVGYKRVAKASFEGNEIRLFYNKSKPQYEQYTLTIENSTEIRELKDTIEGSDFSERVTSHLSAHIVFDINKNIDKIIEFLKLNKTEFVLLSIVDILERCLDPEDEDSKISLSNIIKDLEKFLDKSTMDNDIQDDPTYSCGNIGIKDPGDSICAACYSLSLEVDKKGKKIDFSITTD